MKRLAGGNCELFSFQGLPTQGQKRKSYAQL
jgi:hypothetical protein